MLQRYKKIAHLQVFYLLNVRLFYLDAIRGLFQCPHYNHPLFIPIIQYHLLCVAYSTGLANDSNTNLTRVSHLILDTLSDIK